jgi:hypothetical protein
MAPDDVGEEAGGAPMKPREPMKPHDPPKPPGGMAGAGGAGDEHVDCPAAAPSDATACSTLLACDYPELTCKCEGPEADRRWRCKKPPKPMTPCPPMPPQDAAACVAKEPPAPACHYEEPAVDCTCADAVWTCVAAP